MGEQLLLRFDSPPTREQAQPVTVKPPEMFTKRPLFTGKGKSTLIDWSTDDLRPIDEVRQ